MVETVLERSLVAEERAWRGAGKVDPDHVPGSQNLGAELYRWCKKYRGLQPEQAKRMKDLGKENTRRKRLVADLSLEKQILKDSASGNS